MERHGVGYAGEQDTRKGRRAIPAGPVKVRLNQSSERGYAIERRNPAAQSLSSAVETWP